MKKVTILICLFANFTFLFAKVQDHLRKITDKSKDHQIENIDFIYMINLDERSEKFTRSIEQLHLYGIDPYRFSAVNGWELPLEVINDVGVKYESWMSNEKWGTYYLLDDFEMHHEQIQKIGRNYFCHCMSSGAIGCVLSHLSVLQDAYDSGYETIWVMEDDIDILQNPHLISELIDRLDALVGKDGWDVLYTDPDSKNTNGFYVPCTGFAWRPNFYPPNPTRFTEKYDVSPDFRRVGARYGTYSMIVRRSGIKRILEFLKKFQIFLPFDMELPYPNGILLYTLTYDVVSTDSGAPSDNSYPSYLKKNKK